MDLKRVKKEATELASDSDSCGVSAHPCGEDMTHWKGTITTPCEGGKLRHSEV